MPENKWWLISAEDVAKIRRSLEWAKREIHNGRYVPASWDLDALLHTLDAGLHLTEAIPADFQESEAVDGQDEH